MDYNNDERYWNINLLNKWFLLASILWTISMIWMFIDDNDDEFKNYQREFYKISKEKTEEKYSSLYAEVIDIPKSMRKKYIGYDKRLDVENAKVYGQYEFLKACKDMGITEDISEKFQSEQVVKSYIPAIKN